MQSRISLRALAAGLLLPAAALLLVTACRRSPDAPAPVTAANANPEFTGNAACAPCHANEFEAHRGSRHDLTMRPTDRATLGALAPPTGPVPLAGYALEERNGQMTLTRDVPQSQSLPLNAVLGSGKSGMTYISFVGNESLMETKMSYFPPWHRWDITPGQEHPQAGDGVFGRTDKEEMARKCLACHTVALPTTQLAPEKRLYGVGCEACHGPGRAHIEAVRAKDWKRLQMEKLGAWESKRLNDLCGKCHRSLQDVDVSSPEALMTQRFQTYALLRSKCRTSKGHVLSCLSCHDPHTDANKEPQSYNRVCLTCHASGGSRAAPTGKPCPVNPRADCIACHMKPRIAFPGTTIPAKMADHRISIPELRNHPLR